MPAPLNTIGVMLIYGIAMLVVGAAALAVWVAYLLWKATTRR